MKFKFIGQSNFQGNELTSNKIYNILQLEKSVKGLGVYIINNEGDLIYLSYPTLTNFNENWRYINGE